ncbi:MAG TPA: translation initiation factor IF-2 [Candidatus Marinimicrobia bacterium]|nr:translation initiation factor IF-2 [Candidatus Neomarinimicrobiota bacterium]
MTDDSKIKPKRIFEIAKELNISHIEIIEFLKKEEIPVKTIMSPVDEATYLKILEEFAREKDVVERFRKERARREAESKRKAEEEARKTAEIERKKIESEVYAQATPLIESAIQVTHDYSTAVHAMLIRDLIESDQVIDVTPRAVEERIQEKPVESSEAEKKEPKKKKKEKRKLRRITISDIESRLDQKGGKRRGADLEDARKGKKGKRGANIDERKVEESIRRTMAKMEEKSTRKKYKKQDAEKDEEQPEVNKIKISEYATVETLAKMLDVGASELIAKCIQLGMFVTINQRLDFDTITLIADECGYEVEQVEQYGEEVLKIEDTEEDLKNAVSRPPVVAIMGHVDHGKTSLLDYIRSTSVVAGESGGITQHIGAYKVVLDNKKQITFLDTPGHEAFTAMRARGAQVTDIVVLIVAADDGVMPRTIEAINHAKAASVPIVVAINKIDKPEADIEKVKRGLSEHGVQVEDWGGSVQVAEISAKTGAGIDHLLDLILLESEMLELKANPDTAAKGTVIEAKVDKRHGPMATVLIQKGSAEIGDPFVCGPAAGRVRAIYDERGHRMKKVTPSDPAVIVGFDVLPNLADVFAVVDDEREARKIAAERQKIQREQQFRQAKEWTLDTISQQIAEGRVKQLNVVLKCDVDGSVEAISETLSDMGNEEVAVSITHKAAGHISESDVLLAKASDAIIIGFNVTANPKVREVAKKENVELRFYSIIYDLVDDIKAALEGLLSPEKIEEHFGTIEVREVFKVPKIGFIAGSYVKEGKVHRNAMGRIRRNDEVVYEGQISSLKRFKDDVKVVQEGFECGVALEGFSKYEKDDIIEVFEVKSVKRKLE